MTIQKIEKTTWPVYFHQVSKTVNGKDIEIEISALSLGDQIQARWIPLLGITYDPKGDILEIIVEGVDHLIHKPCEIYADYNVAGLVSLEVVDDTDTKQIIQFREPLMLPSP